MKRGIENRAGEMEEKTGRERSQGRGDKEEEEKTVKSERNGQWKKLMYAFACLSVCVQSALVYMSLVSDVNNRTMN